VTRVGDVKPLMEVACYTCDACGFEIYQEVTGDTFMPIQRCPTGACLNGTSGANLHLQTRACKVRLVWRSWPIRASAAR
jgi:DNA replication licensing factor MCM7